MNRSFKTAVVALLGLSVVLGTGLAQPTITTQPLAAFTIPAGGSKTLSVTAANAESATYQWFKNGTPLPSANTASLVVTSPGSYTVSVITSSGTVTSNASKITRSGNGSSIKPTGVLSGNIEGSVILAGAEIPAYDPLSKRAFASSSAGVQVVDLKNPSTPTVLSTIAPGSLGIAGLSSNDVSSINVRKGTNGSPSVLAIAVINSPKTNPGHVVFVEADTGKLLGSVQVGVVPDHVTFTPDGSKVLVANEGELDGTAATLPDAADGSVSIIDVSQGFSSPTVKTAGFAAWDSADSIANLRSAGVRVYENGIPSKDFEPEYIGVSGDGKKAFVTLQEANAIGILDLVAGAFTDIVPLGKKDFSTGFHDFSDKDGPGGASLVKLTEGNPVKGLYMPDAVASFNAKGETFYVIANEGDDRNDFLTPDESTNVGNAAYVLDPTAFPTASALKQDAALGRLVVSNANGLRGDTDGDGDVDEILSYGGRSFSVLDAQGNMVFDSGDMIERIVATYYNSSFDDKRSDNKGPEPEGITVASIEGVPYAFVGLERSSVILVFDLSNPTQPVYVNGIKRTGDTSPEGLLVVSGSDAPEGRPLLLVTNEVSNTLSVFELTAAPVITAQPTAPDGGVLSAGGKAKLSVSATGTGIAFQWFKNGAPIPNSNTASLEVTSAGSYTVAVTNHLGTATSSASKVIAAGTSATVTLSGNDLSIKPTGVLSGNVESSIVLAGAEIPAYDPVSKRAFASSSTGVQVVDLSNPATPTFVSTIAPGSLGVAELTSSDVSSISVRKGANGSPSVLAIAVINSPKTSPGHVVFVRADTGAFLGSVQVGVVPDHVTFTPDGSKVLVANEGELDGTAATIPDAAEGSVSIIDVSLGFSAPPVTTAGFTAWDSADSITKLRTAGVRIYENGIPSKDFEPEYIGVSSDGRKAFVTLQEANAIGILDLVAGAFTDIVPLGKKDFSAGLHDFSDKDGKDGASSINLTKGNPVKGLYMPDAVASFNARGETFYVIANEGDDRNDFLTPDESTTVGNAAYELDPTVFKDPAALKQDAALGRLVVSNAIGLRGDTNGDGKIDEILSYGGRSFSVLDSQGNMVFDSGDMIERIVADQYSSSFDDKRSDNKGPEPEGVTVANIGGVPYAFVGLERSSLILVFDLSNPTQPVYVNGIKRTGDTSPEGLLVVSESDAPEGRPLLLVTNEVSNTLSVFELATAPVITAQPTVAAGGLLQSGAKVNLSVSATGTGLAVQWFKNGAPVENAHSTSLEVTSTGSYTVSVSNPLGTVTSNAIQIRTQTSLGSLSGEYQGLLMPENESESAYYGMIVATVGKPLGAAATSLAISGKIQRAETSQSFTGKVDAFGRVTFTNKDVPSLALAGNTGASLTLEILSSSSGRTLEGRLMGSGSQKATLLATPVKAAAGTQTGNYTALFQKVEKQAGAHPDGDGYATMAVTATRILLAGKLADGSSVSASLKLTEGETTPLFLPLYKGKGLVAGAIQFDPTQAASDAASLGIRWIRASGVTSPGGYPEGWPSGILVDFVASKYDQSKGFGLPNTSPAGLPLTFTASSGALTGPLEGLTNLLQSNVLKVPVSPVSPIKLTMELAPASGALKGSFMLSGVRTSFSGVVFQKTNDASGFFLSGTKGLTKSGLIQISKKE